MKVNSKPATPRFNPFDLIIRVETEEEAGELYALFCHHYISLVVPLVDHDQIRQSIRDQMPENAEPHYTPAFDAIEEAMRDCYK